MFSRIIAVHQRVMSTQKGAVVFADQVLQVEIFLSLGYRLADEEDGSVYSDGGDLDQFIPRREWPDMPLPEVPEPSLTTPTQASTTVSADKAQLIADLQAVHDATVKSLESMGVNACEIYTQHRVDTVLAKAGPADTVCQLCKKKLLAVHMPSSSTSENIQPARKNTPVEFATKCISALAIIMNT